MIGCGCGKKMEPNFFDYQYKINCKPSKVFYDISLDSDNNNRGVVYQKCSFHHYLLNNINIYPSLEVECYQIKKVQSNNKIILLYIRNKSLNLSEENLGIVYSHNYREDLGKIFPLLVDFAILFKSNIVSYDYTGYGKSGGSPSLIETKSDIEQVMDFCVNNLKFTIENTVLIGKTLGTFPTLYLAGVPKYVSVKGMILITPALGRSFVQGNDKKNYIEELAKEAMCPCLLIHGTDNKKIPYTDSETISKLFRRGITWLPKKYGSKIIEQGRSKFYRKVRMFLSHLIVQRNKKIKHELDMTHESEEANTYLNFEKNQLMFKPELSVSI